MNFLRKRTRATNDILDEASVLSETFSSDDVSMLEEGHRHRVMRLRISRIHLPRISVLAFRFGFSIARVAESGAKDWQDRGRNGNAYKLMISRSKTYTCKATKIGQCWKKQNQDNGK